MGIIENANSIKNVFAGIKAEIENKGISVADGTSVTEYPSLIEAIPTGAGQSPADIFNHGDVTGLNPYYSCNQKLYSSSSYAWKINNEKIYIHTSTNSNIVFGAPIYKGEYTKICFDCEVPEGETDTYNISLLGIRYCKNGMPSDRNEIGDESIAMTNFNTQSNYDNTLPWNTLARCVVEFDLGQIENEPFFLIFSACDCDVNIYSVWLE